MSDFASGRGRRTGAEIAERDHRKDRQGAKIATAATGIAAGFAISAPRRSLRLIVSVISMISVADVFL
jgi:hypothetical protein